MSNSETHNLISRPWLITAAIGVILLGAAYIAFMVYRAQHDPNFVFLHDEAGAKWIRVNMPPVPALMPNGQLDAGFRTRFTVNTPPSHAILTLKALRWATVILDGITLLPPDTDPDEWKKPRQVNLTGRLTPGPHELYIHVSNFNGPCALLAYCSEIGLVTSPRWEVTEDGTAWDHARVACVNAPYDWTRSFTRADKVFLKALPYFLFLSVLTIALAYWFERHPSDPSRNLSALRWLLILLLTLLAANNIGKLPTWFGFDAKGHVAYIKYIIDHHRVPLPSEGWQMFQSPLYYIVSAFFYALLEPFMQEYVLRRVILAIPLICGILQVEILYRAMRWLFPNRHSLQAVGLLTGALMPMNLYMSQGFGNESMAAVFCAAACTCAFAYLRSSPEQRRWTTIAATGLFLGLSLLTKVTVLVLLPLFALLIALAAFQPREGATIPKRILTAIAAPALMGSIILLIAGWYYLRNWIEIGRPFAGGWDPSRGIVWWQYPGYRMLSQLIPSGESFLYPMGAPVTTLPDAVYATTWADGYMTGFAHFLFRPPWNYTFVFSCIFLSLFPTAALFAGAFRAILRPSRALANGTLFALACIALLMAAMVHLYLTLPIYSTAKATYTLGLLPCYAALAAYGLEPIMRRAWTRTLIWAILIPWALSAYLGYFVI